MGRIFEPDRRVHDKNLDVPRYRPGEWNYCSPDEIEDNPEASDGLGDQSELYD